MTEIVKKLLFVDDYPEITESYKEMLPEFGYQVDTANDSVKGYELLKSKTYDIIIFDMYLGDSTGEKMFIELLANPVYNLNRDTPVVIYTGNPDDDTRLRLLDLGIVAYLLKPFEPKALASVLDNLIENDRRRRDSLKLSRQLEDLHRLNNLIFNSLPSGLIVFNSSNQVVLANRISYEILKRSPGTLKDKNLKEVLGESTFEKILAQTEVDPEGRPEADIDLDDITISIGFTISTLTNRKGQKIGNVLIFQDITNIKAIASESRRIERLASMGTLASGIAHEVKNPLAGIKAMAQNIEDALDENPKMKNFAQRIVAQVDRLNELLSGFFSIAKRQHAERRLFPLDTVLNEVLPLVKGTANKKHITIEVEKPEDVKIYGRPDQVQQVLLNLLLNAIDASENSSKITIEVDEPISYPVRRPIFGEDRAPEKQKIQPGDSVIIRVVDNGTGISEKGIEHIFDPFYTTKGHGTGLGLFIVHQLVQDELAGQIDVCSKPGETVFSIILPTVQVIEIESASDGSLELPDVIT